MGKDQLMTKDVVYHLLINEPIASQMVGKTPWFVYF